MFLRRNLTLYTDGCKDSESNHGFMVNNCFWFSTQLSDVWVGCMRSSKLTLFFFFKKKHPQNILGWSQTCHAILCFFFFFLNTSACCRVIWRDGWIDSDSCHYQAERMLRLECERLQLSCNEEAPTTEETSEPNLLFLLFVLFGLATRQQIRNTH